MVVANLQFLLTIAAGAFALAASKEYLCRRMGWRLGVLVGLLTWAVGAVLIVALPTFVSAEEMCSVLNITSASPEGLASLDYFPFRLMMQAVVFALAALGESLCRRMGWGLGVRLLPWAAGGVLIVPLLLDISPEHVCSTINFLKLPSTSSDHALHVRLYASEQVYASLLAHLAAQSLMLWSVLYPVAATVSRSILSARANETKS